MNRGNNGALWHKIASEAELDNLYNNNRQFIEQLTGRQNAKIEFYTNADEAMLQLLLESEEALETLQQEEPDEMNFTCKNCNETFDTSTELTTHLETHADESYECDYCGRELENMKDLRTHLIMMHDNLPCSICEDLFISYDALHMHMLKHREM